MATVTRGSLEKIEEVLGADARDLLQHLSQVEIYLDSGTLLPVALAFNIHPDNDAGLDIPLEMRFSDYRYVSGAQVAFHIQRRVLKKSVSEPIFLE